MGDSKVEDPAQETEPSLSTSPALEQVISCNVSVTSSLKTATHFVLFLNAFTFDAGLGTGTCDSGEALAAQLRLARERGVQLIMIHEQRERPGSCPFERILYSTPDDLVRGGLYSQLAVPLHSSPMEQAVTVALAYRQIRSGPVGSKKGRLHVGRTKNDARKPNPNNIREPHRKRSVAERSITLP